MTSDDATAAPAAGAMPRRSRAGRGLVALRAIIGRDAGTFFRRYGTAIGNVLIPVIVLIVVSAGFDGFRRALEAPYGTYVAFSEYLVPGLVGLVLLLAGAEAALSLVRDRGGESIRFLLAAPLPRWFLIAAKLVSAALLATLQAAALVVVARLTGATVELLEWLVAIPAVFLASLMITSVILALIVFVRAARRLSAVLLYVAVPAFFVSTALYPLWRFTNADADYLRIIADANPFSHAVELIRYASEGQVSWVSLAVVAGVGATAFVLAVIGIDPRRGFLSWRRRTGSWAVGHEG